MNSRLWAVVILLMLMLVPSCGSTPAQPLVVSTSITPSPQSMDATPTHLVVTVTQRPASTPTTRPTLMTTLTPQTTTTPTMLPENHRRWIFKDVWQVVNNHYYDPDFRGVNWDATYTDYEPRILAARTPQEFYATMKEMIAQLNDHHTVYLTPKEWHALKARFDGSSDTGFFAVPVTNSLVITDVFPNGPAAEVGLQPRDRITAVDGRSVPEFLALEATGAVPDLLGVTVELTIRSLDQSMRSVQVKRRPGAGEIVPSSRRLEVDTTIGYLRIPMFTTNMGNQVTRALETLLQGPPLQGLVLDLRSNGGGDLNALKSILGQFVTGTVAQMQDRWGSPDWTVEQSALYNHLQSVPVVVLVDQNTNSSAEMMAAVLQDQDRAKVVGVPTPGNVEHTVLHLFVDRSALLLAVDIFKLPNDSTLDEQGVMPDVRVDRDWTEYAEHNDPYLHEAVQLLTGGSPR